MLIETWAENPEFIQTYLANISTITWVITVDFKYLQNKFIFSSSLHALLIFFSDIGKID